jgi:thiol-disulfide isomerase/thioredoxin
MRPRLVALVAAVAVVLGAALVVLNQNRAITADAPSGSVVENGPPEPPGGEAVTVRLFRKPAAAPNLTIQTIKGPTISSPDLVGKVTLINFWATWCGPCRAEIPDLIALQERYRDHLQIIGISEDEESADAVRAFAAEHEINYPIAMSSDAIRRVFPGVVALPTSFVLDRQGRVAQKHIGLLDRTTTEHETRALAGLPTRASIELVDPDQPVGLANAAQAKEIPGVDLRALSPAKRVETLQRLNAEPCTCGCGLTVAKCRIDDPACGVSLPLARRIAREMGAGDAPVSQP